MQYHLSEIVADFPQLYTRAMYKSSLTRQKYDEVFYRSLAQLCIPFNSDDNFWLNYRTTKAPQNFNGTIHRSLSSFCFQLNKSAIDEGIFKVSAASPKYDEVIYTSLISFCYQLEANYKKVGSHKSPNVTKSYPQLRVNWSGPAIFPELVDAYKFENKVKAYFQIVHTSQAVVFRSESFQFSNISIEYPPHATGAIQSEVFVEINDTECKDGAPVPDVPTNFTFYLNKESDYRVSLSVNVCTSAFDNPLEKVTQYSTSRRKGNITIRQLVPIPIFDYITWNAFRRDDIFIVKDRNTSVRVKVDWLKWSKLCIDVYMWERGLTWLIYDSVEVRAGENGKPEILKGMPSKETYLYHRDLLYVIISRPGDYPPQIKITVDTSGNYRTGQLILRYHQRVAPYAFAPFIQSMEVTQTITLTRESLIDALPRNKVLIHKEPPFECDHLGNKNSPKQGRNCTIRCRAFGRDIKSIIIKKFKMAEAGKRISPVQKVSYIVGDEAFAMLDMGPVSKDIAGKYRCYVQMANGSFKKEDIVLDTDTGYLPITVKVLLKIFTSRRTDIQFSSTHCAVNGGDPLFGNSMVVQKEAAPVWIVMDWSWYHNKNSIGAAIRTTKLMYPAKYLTCLVDDKTSSDNNTVWLYNQNFTYYPEPPVIDTHPKASYVSIFDNSTLKAVCSVISKPDIDVTIFLPALLFDAGKTMEEADIRKLPRALHYLTWTWTTTTYTVVIHGFPPREDYQDINCLAARGMNQVDIMALSRG